MRKPLLAAGTGLLFFVGMIGATQSTPGSQSSQTKKALSKGYRFGPAIESFGQVVVADSDLPVPKDHEYKVVFELRGKSESPEVVNDKLNAVARFINMHVGAGVPQENLDVKVVLHGDATMITMTDQAYRARFGVGNPNIALFDALSAVGADIYVCAQSAGVLGISRDEITPPVKVALSSMTAVALFQSEGYALLPW